MAEHLSRRGILKLAAGSAGAALLAACGGGTAATNTPAGPKATALQGGTGGQTAVPAGTSAPAATTAPAAATSAPAATTAIQQRRRSRRDQGRRRAEQHGSRWDHHLLADKCPERDPEGQCPLLADDVRPAEHSRSGLPRSVDSQPEDIVLPGVNFNEEQYAYGDMLDKLRVVLKANQGPDAAVIVIQWCPELAASGVLSEINLADFGYKPENFWPGALKSVTWNGKLYGIPTNNETMAMIYNKDIFQKAGLDPNKGPETWEDVKNFSKQIKDKTGKAGYGMVAKLNNGNIPYRYMPLTWAYGGGALDEAEDKPTYQKSMFDSDGNIQALQWMYDVFSERAAPQSTLTNTQTEIRDLFTSGEVAIMIDHPVAYQVALAKAPDVAAKMGYVLMPKGPVRRAVAFGGSNYVVFKNAKDQDAAKAVGKDRTSPTGRTRSDLDELQPRQPRCLRQPRAGATAERHQVPQYHDRDAPVRHLLPRHPGELGHREPDRPADDPGSADQGEDAASRPARTPRKRSTT